MEWKVSPLVIVIMGMFHGSLCRYDVWNNIACNKTYLPPNCDLKALPLVTVDDYDRCAPGYLELGPRNHFLGASGRRITYKNNKDAFDRIQITPKLLRNVSNCSMDSTAMGLQVQFPIGVSPVAYHQLASKEGEVDTVRGLSDFNTVMILSMYSNRALEDVAAAVTRDGFPHLWIQTYLFEDRSITLQMLGRAEKAGFKAAVLTVDAPILGTVTCNSRKIPPGVGTPNTNNLSIAAGGLLQATFEDITWLKQNTKMPVIAKGILSGSDAVEALEHGASAIMVSNHGGRQLDGAPATIEALPGVVAAVKKYNPEVEVFVDCGIRSGKDAYKALARGARMAFVGRPSVWGLAIGGSDGVKDVIDILQKELKETMILAGARNISSISEDTLIRPRDICYNQFEA